MGAVRRASRSLLVSACAAWLVWSAAGCGAASQSLRAMEQYSRERPDLTVALDRLADIERSLETVDRLLFDTPYRVGAPWVEALALDDVGADEIEEELRATALYRDPGVRVPISSIYRTHVDRVIDEVRARDATHPSVMAAVESLVRDGPAIRAAMAVVAERRDVAGEREAELEALIARRRDTEGDAALRQLGTRIDAARDATRTAERALEDAEYALDDRIDAMSGTEVPPASPELLADLVTVFSVAFRLESEALALVPVIGQQVARSFRPDALAESVRAGVAFGARGLGDIRARVGRIGEQLGSQVRVLGDMTRMLAPLVGRTLRETAGYALRRTSVGTIARGIVDRVYADAAAGAEARFALFSGPDTDEAPDTSSDLSFDYRGARRVLEYDVQPIVFASFSFAVGLDLTGIPDFLRFDADYATDRVWSSGGSIERSTDVLGELELRGAASDAVRLALGIVGVQGDVVIARFDQGTVDVVDTATGTVEARVPLRFEATEIGAGFDILWAMPQARVRSFADQLEVGFRYLDYSIPRILYGLEDTDGDPDRDRYVYYAETPVQRVHSRYYLGEVRFRRGVHVGGRPGVLYDIDLGLGGGPLDADTAALGVDADRMMVVRAGGRLGWGQALTRPGVRVRADLIAWYGVGIVFSTNALMSVSSGDDDESDLGQVTVDFGGLDMFHGPYLALSVGL